jgi:hypothetical protein
MRKESAICGDYCLRGWLTRSLEIARPGYADG